MRLALDKTSQAHDPVLVSLDKIKATGNLPPAAAAVWCSLLQLHSPLVHIPLLHMLAHR